MLKIWKRVRDRMTKIRWMIGAGRMEMMMREEGFRNLLIRTDHFLNPVVTARTPLAPLAKQTAYQQCSRGKL